ncbi:hypothetical protein EON67_01000 [archaeon]|nr:MAG: hypothetical protein EON67_01000 [archaeon]
MKNILTSRIVEVPKGGKYPACRLLCGVHAVLGHYERPTRLTRLPSSPSLSRRTLQLVPAPARTSHLL